MKNTGQDVAEDVAQDVAEGVLGAAKDGSVLIVAHVTFQLRNQCPTHACRPPRCPRATREGRAHEVRGAGRGGVCTEGCGAGPGLRGLGGARPPRNAITAAAAVLAHLATR